MSMVLLLVHWQSYDATDSQALWLTNMLLTFAPSKQLQYVLCNYLLLFAMQWHYCNYWCTCSCSNHACYYSPNTNKPYLPISNLYPTFSSASINCNFAMRCIYNLQTTICLSRPLESEMGAAGETRMSPFIFVFPLPMQQAVVVVATWLARSGVGVGG